MMTKRKPFLAIATGLLCFLFTAIVSVPAEAHGKHPGRAQRVKSCTTKGDARMTLSVAGHTTDYAVHRFKIQDLVTKADIKRAQDAMYEFLKWKLGNPTAVCVQYISTGYGHFAKAYSDEAGAALLVFKLPKEKGGHSQFYLPPQLVDLELKINKTLIPLYAAALQAEFRIPAFVSKQLLNAWFEARAKGLKRLGINIPKKYDFPNELVLLAIDTKRNPKATQARLQHAIDKAESEAGGAPKGRTPRKPRKGIISPLKRGG